MDTRKLVKVQVQAACSAAVSIALTICSSSRRPATPSSHPGLLQLQPAFGRTSSRSGLLRRPGQHPVTARLTQVCCSDQASVPSQLVSPRFCCGSGQQPVTSCLTQTICSFGRQPVAPCLTQAICSSGPQPVAPCLTQAICSSGRQPATPRLSQTSSHPCL